MVMLIPPFGQPVYFANTNKGLSARISLGYNFYSSWREGYVRS